MGRPGSDSFLVVPAGPLSGEAKLPARAPRSTFGMCTEELCGKMKYLKPLGFEARWGSSGLFNLCTVLRLPVNH